MFPSATWHRSPYRRQAIPSTKVSEALGIIQPTSLAAHADRSASLSENICATVHYPLAILKISGNRIWR